jgi:K(+)-stimulated pyrophosphate-energized sodium pump
MEGTKEPNYGRVVGICTLAAQKELLGLGLIAVSMPVIVGLLLGELPLGGFLAGVILAGQMLAVFMANAGGAWDNAKKTIEDGLFGGKGSESHKASVVGDTVGDPLKDTAGPALNPAIKVMNLVAMLVLPTILVTKKLLLDLTTPETALLAVLVQVGVWLVCAILIGIVLFAIVRSRRSLAISVEDAPKS